MPLGAHMSIAGGLHLAIARARDVGCETVQIFTKSPTQWRSRRVSPEEVESFKNALARTSIQPVVAHDAYLINLGSPERTIYERSVKALADEIDRTATLGISTLVVHPGSIGTQRPAAGIARIGRGLRRALARAAATSVGIALETTAGQGFSVGSRFSHLRDIIDASGAGERLAICIDTCHLYAAGYDISTGEGYEKTLEELEALVGLQRLKVIHVNDSKKGLASRVDRHEHLGRGALGLDAFRFIVTDARLRDVPQILETPKGKTGRKRWDAVNLGILKRLRSAAVPLEGE